MEKQTLVLIHKGVLLSHEKEIPVTHNNTINLKDTTLSEINQTKKYHKISTTMGQKRLCWERQDTHISHHYTACCERAQCEFIINSLFSITKIESSSPPKKCITENSSERDILIERPTMALGENLVLGKSPQESTRMTPAKTPSNSGEGA